MWPPSFLSLLIWRRKCKSVEPQSDGQWWQIAHNRWREGVGVCFTLLSRGLGRIRWVTPRRSRTSRRRQRSFNQRRRRQSGPGSRLHLPIHIRLPPGSLSRRPNRISMVRRCVWRLGKRWRRSQLRRRDITRPLSPSQSRNPISAVHSRPPGRSIIWERTSSNMPFWTSVPALQWRTFSPLRLPSPTFRVSPSRHCSTTEWRGS